MELKAANLEHLDPLPHLRFVAFEVFGSLVLLNYALLPSGFVGDVEWNPSEHEALGTNTV